MNASSKRALTQSYRELYGGRRLIEVYHQLKVATLGGRGRTPSRWLGAYDISEASSCSRTRRIARQRHHAVDHSCDPFRRAQIQLRTRPVSTEAQCRSPSHRSNDLPLRSCRARRRSSRPDLRATNAAGSAPPGTPTTLPDTDPPPQLAFLATTENRWRSRVRRIAPIQANAAEVYASHRRWLRYRVGLTPAIFHVTPSIEPCVKLRRVAGLPSDGNVL